jgi:thiol:disulfide interchange protein DsbA
MSRFFAWLLLLVFPLAGCAQAPAGPPQAGVDYELLQGGQRWQQAPDGKIEVVEVFAYWCPHCADFQPMVDAWKRRKPADVNFVYVPAAFDPEDAYARAFFAADLAKALPKTHQALFDAVHEEGALPRSNVSIDELGTWFGQRGLNRAKMVASMRSKDVDTRMARARDFIVANRIGSTPSLIVNGKYVVRARSLEDRLRVVDGLIAMERAAAKKR